MILTDRDIRKLCTLAAYHGGKPMIEPFSEAVSGNGVISYGLTTAGYDLRLADKFVAFRRRQGFGLLEQDMILDPKAFKDNKDAVSEEINVPTCDGFGWLVLPANSYVLGHSVEYLRVPRHLKAQCVGKSTLARCGILINTTPLEPEWEGHLTIEIGNVTPLPAKVYVGEGIAQLEFHLLSGDPETSYKDKGGKYQGQTGVTAARVQ